MSDIDIDAILNEFDIKPVEVSVKKAEPVKRKKNIVREEGDTLIPRLLKAREETETAEKIRQLALKLKGSKVKKFLTDIAKKIKSKRHIDKERFELDPIKRYDRAGYEPMKVLKVGKWDNKSYEASLRRFYEKLSAEKYATHTDAELIKEWADENPSVYDWVKKVNKENSEYFDYLLRTGKMKRAGRF